MSKPELHSNPGIEALLRHMGALAPTRHGRCIMCKGALGESGDHSICDACWPQDPEEQM
jgi:hypothetical protein